MPVRKDDPRPAYAQIADDVRQQITDGRLAPDARLPSTSELAQTYGVAKMTAQQAVRRLREQGLVRSIQGRGVFVNDPAANDTDRDPSANAGANEPATLEDALRELREVNRRLDELEGERDQSPSVSHDPGPSPSRGHGIGD